jgi:hypothetical protein
MTVAGRLKLIFARRGAWRSMCRGEDGALNAAALTALADLSRFCYADRSTIKVSPVSQRVDPMAMAVAEGRREVWLRIVEMLKLDDRDLQALLKQHNDEVFSND